MAYGEKYYLTFRDRRDIRWKCHVYKNGYSSGINNIICTGEPLVFEIRASGDVFDPIKIQEATLNIVVNSTATQNLVSEFKTAQIFDFYLFVEKETGVATGVYNNYYKGTQVTDIYTEPYMPMPYNIVLKFSDLGDLDFVEYKDTGGFWKQFSMLSKQIYNCVQNLPFSYDLIDVINLFPNEITEIDSTAATTKIFSNNEAYVKYDFDKKIAKGESCLSVLRKILSSLGARMYQYNSYWYVVRINEMLSAVDTPVRYNQLTYASSYASSTANNTMTFNKTIDNTEANGIAISNGAELSMDSLIDVLIYKYTNQEPVRNGNNLIFNSQIDKDYYELALAGNYCPNFWSCSPEFTTTGANNIISSQDVELSVITYVSGHPVIIPKGSFAFLPQIIENGRTQAQGGLPYVNIVNTDQFYINAFNPITDGNTYYAQEYVNCVVSDKLRIKITGRYIYRRSTAVYVYQTFLVFQRFYIAIKQQTTGDIWYLANGPWTKTNPVPSNFTFELKANDPASDQLTDNPFTLEMDSGNLPFTGMADYIEFRFFVPLGSAFESYHRIDSAVYDSVSVQYITNDQTADETIISNNELTITPRKNIERIHHSFHGDGPFSYSLGSLWYKDLSTILYLTTQWHRRGEVDAKTFAEHFIYTFFGIYSGYSRKLSIPIYSLINLYQRIVLNDGFIYLIDGYSFSVKQSVYQTQLIEITEKPFVYTQPGTTLLKEVVTKPDAVVVRPPKAKYNGVISANVATASIVGKTTITTETETAGNYPG